MDNKLLFGIHEGVLVDITQVDSGLDCRCTCPACDSPLVAKKGAKTAHYFAHHKSVQCPGAFLTAIHWAAKEILTRNTKILLPSVMGHIGYMGGGAILYSEQTVEFDRVSLIKKTDHLFPHVVIELGTKKLYVEIRTLQGIDAEKREDAFKMEMASALEIDISGLNGQITFAELEKILTDDVGQKKWIHNTKVQAFYEDLLFFTREFPVTRRRMAAHIDNCPLPARVWNNKPYANLIDDCFSCPHFFSSEGDEMDSHTHIRCIGHAKDDIQRVIEKHTKA